jgi:hypothetical protein
MGVFDFLDIFKNQQKLAASIIGAMYGVDTRGIKPVTEAAEWLQELPPEDPRHGQVSPALLEGNYYLINRQRQMGAVFRVTPELVEVRLPFLLKLPTGVEVPDSHLYRSLPARALCALPRQRAQKVIENIFKEAGEVFQQHHKVCRGCFKRVPPERYPGHPNEGILGLPAVRVTVCAECQAVAAQKEEAAKLAAKEAAKQELAKKAAQRQAERDAAG